MPHNEIKFGPLPLIPALGGFITQNLRHQACAVFSLTLLRIPLCHREHTQRHTNHKSVPFSLPNPPAAGDFFRRTLIQRRSWEHCSSQNSAKQNEDLSYWLPLNQGFFSPAKHDRVCVASSPFDVFQIAFNMSVFLQ